MPAWSEQSPPPDPDQGIEGVIRAIEVWEQAENYDEPERYLGEEVAEGFRPPTRWRPAKRASGPAHGAVRALAARRPRLQRWERTRWLYAHSRGSLEMNPDAPDAARWRRRLRRRDRPGGGRGVR